MKRAWCWLMLFPLARNWASGAPRARPCRRGPAVSDKGPLSADVVFKNGNIYTNREGSPRAEAIAIKDGRIVQVGSTIEVAPYERVAPRVVDLKGRTVVPGLVDAHVHLSGIGAREATLNLEGIASLDAFLAAVKAEVAKKKSGEWVKGRGWIETFWKPPVFPTRGRSRQGCARQSRDPHASRRPCLHCQQRRIAHCRHRQDDGKPVRRRNLQGRFRRSERDAHRSRAEARGQAYPARDRRRSRALPSARRAARALPRLDGGADRRQLVGRGRSAAPPLQGRAHQAPHLRRRFGTGRRRGASSCSKGRRWANSADASRCAPSRFTTTARSARAAPRCSSPTPTRTKRRGSSRRKTTCWRRFSPTRSAAASRSRRTPSATAPTDPSWISTKRRSLRFPPPNAKSPNPAFASSMRRLSTPATPRASPSSA